MAVNDPVAEITTYVSQGEKKLQDSQESHSDSNLFVSETSQKCKERHRSSHQVCSDTSIANTSTPDQGRRSPASKGRANQRDGNSGGGDSKSTMMSSGLNLPPLADHNSRHDGLLPAGALSGSQMTDSSYSMTDITLDQAVGRLQEIEKENMALRDNLRQHNATVKKQYESLAEWRKKENDKFEQTKALITALSSENQELQVKVMTLNDKEKELSQRLHKEEEEKSHILRQKAISDQRVVNVYKKAEEQGVKGFADCVQDEEQDVTDAIVFVTTTEKEGMIAQLKAAVESRDRSLEQLRSELLQKDQEVAKYRETTKQLLKDMEGQQQLKESIEKENRTLTSQIMQAEEKLHKQMQSVMATTKREMQAEQMFSSSPSSSDTSYSKDTTASPSASDRGAVGGAAASDNFAYPQNVEDLMGIAHSLDAKEKVEQTIKQLRKKLEEERKIKEETQADLDKSRHEVQALSTRYEESLKDLREARQQVTTTADELAQEYEQKLMEMAKQSKQETQTIAASDTEDMSILRSQVLTLIKEVDDAQKKLSAAMAAISHKDSRILELDQISQRLRQEFADHWQETNGVIQNLRMQLAQQQKAQQDNGIIKQQHQQLQGSFSKLVTDYKELQETFEAYRQHAERQGPRKVRKETMEEINRLTAQVIAADEAIALRDEQIAKLKRDSYHSSELDEKIQVFQMQADVYKGDFEAEREARTKLAQEKTEIEEEKNKLHQEVLNLQEQNRILMDDLEGYNRRQINDMQQRHQARAMQYEGPNRLRATPPLAHDYMHNAPASGGQTYATVAAAGGHHSQYGASMTAQPPPTHVDFQEGEAPSFQEFECPSCNARFPDIDSLQLHVPECIDNNSANAPF